MQNFFWLPLHTNVPILMQVLFKKKGSLLLKTFMLQDLPRTATVSRPCELNGLVYHHFQFYATGLLHTIGPLIILVSMRAGKKKDYLSKNVNSSANPFNSRLA